MLTIAGGIILAVILLYCLPLFALLAVILAIVAGVVLLLCGSTAIAWLSFGPLAGLAVFIGGCFFLCHLDDQPGRAREAARRRLHQEMYSPDKKGWGPPRLSPEDHEAALRKIMGYD